MIITINPTERIIISRSAMQNSAQYQVLEPNGWETKTRKNFEGSWKGDIISAMKEEFARWNSNVAGQFSRNQKLSLL